MFNPSSPCYMITYLLDKLHPDPPPLILLQRLTLKNSVIWASLPLDFLLGSASGRYSQEVRERQTERKNRVPRSSHWPSLSAGALTGHWFHLFACSGLWLIMASWQITGLGYFIILGWFPSTLPHIFVHCTFIACLQFHSLSRPSVSC